MSDNALVPRARQGISRAMQIVPYLTSEEVEEMVRAVAGGRNVERDQLLILVLYQTGLRVSEALSLTPGLIGGYEGRAVLHVVGKGKKRRMVACPSELAYRIQAYAYRKGLGPDARIFPITRARAWQIVKGAGEKAGKTGPLD